MYNFTVSKKKKFVVFNLGNGAVIKVKGKSVTIYDPNGNERVLKFGEACNTFKVDMDGNEVINVRTEGEFERTIRGIFKRFYGFSMANEVPALALLYPKGLLHTKGDDNVITRTNQDGVVVCAHNGTNYWFSPELCSSVDAEILCRGNSALIPNPGSHWVTPPSKLVSEYFKSNAFLNDISGNHRSTFDPVDMIEENQLRALGFYATGRYLTGDEFVTMCNPNEHITDKMLKYYCKMCTYTAYEKPKTKYAHICIASKQYDFIDPDAQDEIEDFINDFKEHDLSNDRIIEFIANKLSLEV